jgi:hypothetical protein
MQLLVVGERTYHYEVEEVVAAGAEATQRHGGESSARRFTTPGEFFCADFTVNLSVDTAAGTSRGGTSSSFLMLSLSLEHRHQTSWFCLSLCMCSSL